MSQSPIQPAPPRPGEYSQQDAIDDLLRRRTRAILDGMHKKIVRRFLKDLDILNDQELEEFLKDFDLEALLREQD